MHETTAENPFRNQRLNSVYDFNPAWDVLTVGEEISRRLTEEIFECRKEGWLNPNPNSRISVLLGPSGYGKTHLFGRIAHTLGNKALFVQVPPLFKENLNQPLSHIAWNAVETLFEKSHGKLSVISRVLMHLGARSIRKYIEGLPEKIRTKLRGFERAVDSDPRALRELIDKVQDIQPYLRFAESLAGAVSESPSDTLRALALGWSPAAAEARRWLRGDELTEPENHTILGLPDRRPSPASVITAIAQLLRRVRLPLVICVDQIEAVLRDIENAPRQLTDDLMGLLQSVPNLKIIVSCLESEWKNMTPHTSSGFERRVDELKLPELNPDQAVELVERRLVGWPGRPKHLPESTWPISGESIRELTERKNQRPSGMLNQCASAIDYWWQTDRTATVRIPVSGGGTIAEKFRREWEAAYNAVLKDTKCPEDLQEAELFETVREAVTVAQVGRLFPAGISISRIQDNALPKVSGEYPPAVNLTLTQGTRSFDVVVSATKLNSGRPFTSFITALNNSLGGTVTGAVLVRPSSDLLINSNSQGRKRYDQLIESNQLRPYPLNDPSNQFDLLRCLLEVIRKTQSGNLIINDEALSLRQCRELIIELKLLEGLKLFETVFSWFPSNVPQPAPAAEAGPTAPGSTTPTATQPPPVLEKPKALPQPKPQPAESPAERYLHIAVERLRAYGQTVEPDGFVTGPTFIRLKVRLKGTAEVGRIRSKAESLKTHLQIGTRPLIEGQAGYVSIDVQRPDREFVLLGDVLASRPSNWAGRPAFCIGTDVGGQPHWLDLSDPGDCHVLVAGTTGSGKSEFLKAILGALAAELEPQSLQFILIDPKQVTFNFAGESPYFRAPVANDIEKALPLIEEVVTEMDRRYALLKSRHLEHVGQLSGAETLPRIVLVFDEFADLMSDSNTKKEMEKHLRRLGGMARAAGIHLILGTQRPEASVVTPLLRSNLPGRVSLRVASERDAKLILDDPNAAHLLNQGDLFWKRGGGILRLQSPYIGREELGELLCIA